MVLKWRSKDMYMFPLKNKIPWGASEKQVYLIFFYWSIFVNEFIIVTSKYPKIGFILISLLHRWSVLEGLNCAYGVHRFTCKCKFWEIEIEVLAQRSWAAWPTHAPCISCYFSPLILIFYIWIFGITVWLTWIDSNLNFLLWL